MLRRHNLGNLGKLVYVFFHFWPTWSHLSTPICPYIYALFQVIGEIILMELKMHRQRIYRSTNAIHPKFVPCVSCMHTTQLAVVLLIYKASSRLERHFCMWHVASTNQNHVHFCGLVVSLWFHITVNVPAWGRGIMRVVIPLNKLNLTTFDRHA